MKWGRVWRLGLCERTRRSPFMHTQSVAPSNQNQEYSDGYAFEDNLSI